MKPATFSSLDSILLAHDRRGMTLLQPFLPAEYCRAAAQFALDHPGCVFITTGFYLTAFGTPESDGPPGALAIGQALSELGRQVVYVTDCYADGLLNRLKSGQAEVVTFPLAGEIESRDFARQLIDRYRPALLISIERCGITAAGIYLNAHGKDITAYTARIDLLFEKDIPSIGIGDGGNEIGMGKLAEIIPTIPGLPVSPAITCTTALVIASVSNWGAYGLVAGLSVLAGRDLLPGSKQEEQLLQKLFENGCYDSNQPQPGIGVDGFTPKENSQVLENLHTWLRTRL